MAAQVLRDKGAVAKMDYIICTGTVRRRDLCKFNRGLLANVTTGVDLDLTVFQTHTCVGSLFHTSYTN